ncbi:tRNA-dihydrouridine synthase, partial [Yersinia enterocolitica]
MYENKENSNPHQSGDNSSVSPQYSHSRFSVAPMLDWTDRHCRYFHRLLTKQTLLYTEMVTTG